MNENDLRDTFIERVPHALPNVRVFRRTIVNALVTRGDRTFQVRNGIVGQADSYALVKGGLHIELEMKSARGDLSDEQRAWQAFCRAWSIPHLVVQAHADETSQVTIERWVMQLRGVIMMHKYREVTT